MCETIHSKVGANSNPFADRPSQTNVNIWNNTFEDRSKF